MQIQINFGDIETSQPLADHVSRTVESAIGRFSDRVTRVEVHLRDDKQKRSGPDDNRCLMEARPAGDNPLAVEATGQDIYATVRDCSEKLGRAVTRHFERRS